jgi:hypothetical protein
MTAVEFNRQRIVQVLNRHQVEYVLVGPGMLRQLAPGDLRAVRAVDDEWTAALDE